MQPFNPKSDLNGFCFGMPSKIFKKLKQRYGEFFDNSVKWGGNEEALAKRLKELNIESYIIPRVWVNHDKQRGWKLNGLK